VRAERMEDERKRSVRALVVSDARIREHSSAYVSIRQHTSAVRALVVSDARIRQHPSASVNIRQHTSAYVSCPCARSI
jgi:hypothetical protein